MYGAVPPVGVKSIAPVGEPHCDWIKANSPFTPPLTVIVGTVPHFGEMLFGSNGQVAPGEAEVHAKNKLVIFNTSPQL